MVDLIGGNPWYKEGFSPGTLDIRHTQAPVVLNKFG